MAIPTYDHLKSKVLQIMKDGEIRSVRDLTEIIMPMLANDQDGLSDMQIMTRVA
jgi:restriction endonuclease Mrr